MWRLYLLIIFLELPSAFVIKDPKTRLPQHVSFDKSMSESYFIFLQAYLNIKSQNANPHQFMKKAEETV